MTPQHSLVNLIAHGGNEESFRKEVASLLLADAIRRYVGPRQFSHFEESADGKDVAWLVFPSDLKSLTAETAQSLKKYIPENAAKGFLGEVTRVDVFEKHNKDLPIDEFFGIKKHLLQDCVFDIWIRQQLGLVDFTKSDEEVAEQVKKLREIQGEEAKAIRNTITQIEEHGIYLLAYRIYQKFGITVNQEWFDRNVKDVLDVEYCQDLADGTYNFMKIRPEINEMITNHDWSAIDSGMIPRNAYEELYKIAIKQTAEAENERVKKLSLMK